jgi:hypothetical protein
MPLTNRHIDRIREIESARHDIAVSHRRRQQPRLLWLALAWATALTALALAFRA